MKHALVTGASRGIGRAIALALLKQNWRVTGTTRMTEFPDELRSHDLFTGLISDFSNMNSLARSLKPFVFEARPEVLVNNVGTFQEADFSMDDDRWLEIMNQTLQVNLTAAAMLCKWFVNAHTTAGSQGILINIASRAAYRGDTQEFAAYAASKGAMVALTKSVARGFGRQGIVAYSIAPGFTNTDMARDSIKTYGVEYLTRDSSFDQMTQPEEVANIVAFLSSGQVKHMTGSTFHVNGGSYMV
jgi:NAD(P)-dependent dehydrogenase (short-subunit alcohol dehydrogenase family)